MRALPWLIVFCLALAAPTLAATAWTAFKSEDGRFQILLPGAPTTDNDATEGAAQVHDMVFDLGTGGVYRLKVTDHPAGWGDERPKGERLQELQDQLMAGMPGAQILSAKTITQGEWQGRTFSFSTDGGKLVHRARLYLVGDRLYFLDAAVAASAAKGKTAVGVARFLASFKILKK